VWRCADYVVFNVSSPNTPGLRDLQEREPLVRLLAVARELAGELGPVPVLVKLSPDLSTDQLRVVAEVAASSGAAGLIATNTTISRPGLTSGHSGQAGGLSGRPLADLARSVLIELRRSSSLPIVSVGGIFSADDVLDRLRAGASLVQLYTSFVYQGPSLLRNVKESLVAHLEAKGAADLQALVRASG
jgi:dihydroorotate dehydrogenase